MKKKFLLYFFVLLVLFGCSTQKNTWLSRGYHNLTARYNVLFNGEQSFKEGRESTRESMKNDYASLLPMFAYSEDAGAQPASAQMKRAIEKGHKLIEKHSITVKPNRSPSGGNEAYREFYSQREFNRWVDDAWMMIGKSHLYSREWYESIRAFERVLQTFPEKSVRFEAMIWLARAYIEIDDFDNAGLYLERYSSEIDNEKRYYAEFNSTYAWFWLARRDFEKALDYSVKAAESTSDRWQRIRWHFVLGQVAERVGRLDIARVAYSKVVKMNPDYEFSIHARVKSALLEGGPDNPEIAREELSGYAREHKNLDFRDQIYYALAETWFWEGDTLNALANLQIAAGYSGSNRTLAGNIYHRMADVFFSTGDYVAADAYYDSTLTVLPEDYAGISEVENLKKKLEPLARSLQTIQHEDSVQRIAALPEGEREQFIDDLLVQLEEQESQGQFRDDTDDAFFYRNFSNKGGRTTDETGGWYFYNQTMVSLGEMEFEKRWGRRELEDNWRRKSKESQPRQDDDTGDTTPSDPFDGDPPGPGQSDESEEPVEESGAPDRESLIAGLPLTPEEMETSHLKAQTALFNAGHFLSHNFGKYTEAVEMFERLLSDYPRTAYREQTLMGIYMACREIPQRDCMSHYGEVILDDYPESRFADFIRNPDYFEKQEAVKQEMEELYALAYNDFSNGRWNNVLQKTGTIINRNHDPLMPQAFLLNALAYSQTGNQGQFKSQLEHIVENYPKTSQSRVAGQWLEMLDEGHQPEKLNLAGKETDVGTPVDTGEEEVSGLQEQKSRFVAKSDTSHHILLVVNGEADINQLMFQLANFNFDRHATKSYQIGVQNFEDARQIVETGPFENRKNGMDYLFALLDNPSVFRVNNIGEPIVLLVSENNREILETRVDLEEYRNFFLETYLEGSDPSSIVVNESEIPEKSYVESQVPVFSSVFTPNRDEVWGMIIATGSGGDMSGAQDFLPDFTRRAVRYRLSVAGEVLPGDKEIMLVKTFRSVSDFEDFKASLLDNNIWDGRIMKDDWVVCPISPDNFKKLQEEEGDLKEYLDYLGL